MLTSPFFFFSFFFFQQQGEFRCTTKAIYKVTDEGRRLAHWDLSRPPQDSPNASSVHLGSNRPSGDDSEQSSFDHKKVNDPNVKIHRRISLAEKLNANYDPTEKKSTKESNTDRLHYILGEPGLRSLFREFLRGNFSEENLSFWIDVQDFKQKFNITSSAMAATPVRSRHTPGQVVMERHHESLINTAFDIYNTYLAPSSQCELNIDHGLRTELVKYLEDVVTTLTGKTLQGRVEPDQLNAFNATQLQKMIHLYERIQMHVFRLMATDSVPKVHVLFLYPLLLLISFYISSLRLPSFWLCEIGLKILTQLKTISIFCRLHLQCHLVCPMSKKSVGLTSLSLLKQANENIDNISQLQV